MRPTSASGIVRVVVSAVGFSVTVSAPMTVMPLRTVVTTVETPLSSVAVTATLAAAPTSTVLFVPPVRTNFTVGRMTSSTRLPPACVGRRVSQLTRSTTPRASADRRASVLMSVILCSTSPLLARRL